MLSLTELHVIAKKYKINESVILREYFQLLALQKIYSFPGSAKTFFKGGTCLHLLYGMPRFSEDLDFTVQQTETEFLKFLTAPFQELAKENNCTIQAKKTITGKKFLLTARPEVSMGPVFITFDFSFRESVQEPQKKIIETNFPILFNTYIHCLSEEEILAEKIRAIVSRDKGRDYYDIWYLLSRGTVFREDIITEKLAYYHITWLSAKQRLKEKTEKLRVEDFVMDVRPFIPVHEREKLGDFCHYVKDYILKKI